MLNKILQPSIAIISIFLFSCTSPDSEIIYDYSFVDINVNSSNYGETIGPALFENYITLHYFGHQYWSDCAALVGKLNDLYNDLLLEEIENVKIIVLEKSNTQNIIQIGLEIYHCPS